MASVGDIRFRQPSRRSFRSSHLAEDGRTELATIQFNVLKEGIPLAWVVDLCPNLADASYSSATMRYPSLAFPSKAMPSHLLGFCASVVIFAISRLILGVEIPVLFAQTAVSSTNSRARNNGKGWWEQRQCLVVVARTKFVLHLLF